MTQYAFEKVTRDYQQRGNNISITKVGSIGLSSGFYREQHIATFTYVNLYYDDSNKAIGLEFTKTPDHSSLRLYKNGTGAALDAAPFLKARNIPFDKYAGKKLWEKRRIPDVGEVYIIQLDKPS